MNPHVSIDWFEIAFPVALTVDLGVQLWRQRPPGTDRLCTIGLLGLVLALAGASAANLFYQHALYARAWPTTGIFDQIKVTSKGDVFVMLKDPIMGRADRVQRYNCQGDFKAAFQPDNGGRSFKIAVNEDNTLSIYSVRTDTVDIFSSDGTFLRRHTVQSQDMPFDFLKPGPSVTTVDGCEFTVDPISGQPAVRNSGKVWPLEGGDWVLEYILTRQNIIVVILISGLMMLFSYSKSNRKFKRDCDVERVG